MRDGQVKLLDFGIAKLLEGRGRGPTTLTARPGRALTPEYAAPGTGDGGVITTATDVYALGVLLYQLLVGRHPTAPTTARRPPISSARSPRTSAAAERRVRSVAGRPAPRILNERGTPPREAPAPRLPRRPRHHRRQGAQEAAGGAL